MCLQQHIMKIINFDDKAAILFWTKVMLSLPKFCPMVGLPQNQTSEKNEK